MQKRLKIIFVIVIVAILVFVPLFWILTVGLGGRAVDYWATYDEFDSIAKEGNNKIIFTMPEVSGYPYGKVGFTDCAFSFEVNGTSLPPVNMHLDNHMTMGPYWQMYAQISKGEGEFNSVTFLQSNVSYIVTFIDSDDSDYITQGDFVTVECTEPLTAETSYALDVCVDIDGTWGIGLVYGTFQN
jgi:hypothetical protein